MGPSFPMLPVIATGKMEPKNQIKFMTYNVWSREDVVVYKRMKAIISLVKGSKPDVIFFQEIAPYIHSILESSEWWKEYQCSPVFPEEQATKQQFCLLLSKLPLENFARWKFSNSPTGRGYLEADINPDPATMKPIRVATTQLERPNLPASMHCMERYVQAEHAVAALSSADNVVFGGDMCWGDDTDRPFPLPAGWADAWTQLNPHDSFWTYDSIWDEEVRVFNGHIVPYDSMKKRSDRFICKLKDYRLSGIRVIGDNAIGLRCERRKVLSSFIDLYPSCHRGLVLTILPN
ncbi:hypothetical protein ACP70R_005753 [Stipagrostis hirtigluma subsp. patula]